ncbi:MarR family winged helix-turn-helix transcriptional regulator [Zhongshania aquimaris]|uniref:MarR family transcriptional regulator n=1 Tax=Zhongshania aquimaris TaxID=2857107 RepID=A0ABS6VR45_9GAMM|nr:MarR family transcriptional regulator [Zhongshania aquimaris]MBW2940746.1 MarR family transcriptional regulator [Zhongshania aquimaris]
MDDKRITVDELHRQQEANWPEMYAATKPAVLRILRASDVFTNQTTLKLKEHTLSRAEFDALATLRRQAAPHRITPTALCKALLISSGGLTKLLYRLESAELIKRPASPEDGRSLLVQLSPKGKKLIEGLVATIGQLHTDRLRNLTDTEQAQLDHLLRKMLQDNEGEALTREDHLEGPT